MFLGSTTKYIPINIMSYKKIAGMRIIALTWTFIMFFWQDKDNALASKFQ